MQVIVTDEESKQILNMYNYKGMLNLCNGDKEMLHDYIKFLRKKGGTHINKRHEIWQLLEQQVFQMLTQVEQ